MGSFMFPLKTVNRDVAVLAMLAPGIVGLATLAGAQL